jgi:hypothetical protein
MEWVDLDVLRQGQRPDTSVTLEGDRVTLDGYEVRLERFWFRESFWARARDVIVNGYVEQDGWVEIVVRQCRRRKRDMIPLLITRLQQSRPSL